MNDEDLTPKERENVLDDILLTKSKVLTAINDFEAKILYLSSHTPEDSESDVDMSGVLPVSELIEEDRERFRELFFEKLRQLFNELAVSNSKLDSTVYENGIYGILSDRLQRSIGFYLALSRCDEELRRIHQSLGDQESLLMDFDAMGKILHGVDEVSFIRSICMVLGVGPEDSDLIVRRVVEREFPVRQLR